MVINYMHMSFDNNYLTAIKKYNKTKTNQLGCVMMEMLG